MDYLFVRQLPKLVNKYRQQMNQKCNNPAPRTWTILLREVLLRLLQETDVCEISFSSFWESILSVIIFTNKNENNTTVLIKENCIEANVKSVFQICPDNMEGEKSFLFLSLSVSQCKPPK